MNDLQKSFEDLLIDYFSGEISKSDCQLFFELMQRDEKKKLEFDNMLKIRAIAASRTVEKNKQANFQQILKTISHSDSQPKSAFRISNFRNIAAVVALIISVSVATYSILTSLNTKNQTAFWYETVAPIGSQTKIILPDSSIVWLNSGSTLKYNQAFGNEKREVNLTGEGYFEIAKNKTKPFVVHVDSINVQVLGTIFNIRAYNDDSKIVVNLIEGLVNVTLNSDAPRKLTTLNPNDQLIYDKQSKNIQVIEADASRSALWTTGKLCFVDADLEQIFTDLERKFNVQIQLTNPKVLHEHFSGSLNLNLSLMELLTYIDVDKKFNITQKSDSVYIAIK